MPTNMFLSRQIFDDAYNTVVLASMEGLRSAPMISIDPAAVTADQFGSKILRPGTVIVSANGAASGFGRALPGATATAVTTTAQAAITVNDVTTFRVGDVLVKGLPGATAALGTISAINATTRVITLAANTTTAVAIADPIWVAVAQSTIKGIIVTSVDILQNSNDVACYTSASVYGARLPFWNSLAQAALPGIVLVP